jgi:hypothetical protein
MNILPDKVLTGLTLMLSRLHFWKKVSIDASLSLRLKWRWRTGE